MRGSLVADGSEGENRDGRLLEAAHPDPPVVLPDAGDHVVAATVHGLAGTSQSWTSVPASSNAWTRTVRFGFGCSRAGIRVTCRRSHTGPDWRRSTSGSRGLAMVTQINPSLPRAMLSG